MVRNIGWRFTLIAAIVGLLGWQAYKGVTQGDLELGIDLKGGSELIFKFDFTDIDDTRKQAVLKEAIGVIEQRVDRFGLKDIVIQPIGNDRFAVQVSAQDKANVDSIKSLVTNLGELQFRITVEPGAENYKEYWKKYQERKKKGLADKVAAQINVEDLIASDRDRYPYGLRWFPLSDAARDRNWSARVPTEDGKSQPFILCKLDGENITGASLEGVSHQRDLQGLGGGWGVYFNVKKFSHRGLASLTSKKGDFMAIILNDQVHSAPTLQSRLSDSGQITGGFTEDSARSLAAILQAGSLKEKPQLISERTIAPELAGNARDRGVLSVLIGFCVVLGIMIYLYMGPGLLANLALLLNLVLLVGVLTWFGAVLTLPGIAGVVLTVGMAVDANILVFERIKEERGRGRSDLQAIGIGFDRALVTIVDANLTTLITAYFLFQIGSGPVRGFGITLAIGIIASMFTALYVTRTFFAWLLKRGGDSKIAKMKGEFKVTGVCWTNYMRKAVTFSACAMVVGALLWDLVPEKVKYDLDFTKGSKLIIRFSEPRSIESVGETMKGLDGGNKIYQGIAVRASASGIGADVATDMSSEYELRSQDIADAKQIEDFKSELSAAFAGKLLPGPLLATIKQGATGGATGRLFLVSNKANESVLRAVLAQYTDRTRRLEGATVKKAKTLPPGAGAAFELQFPNARPEHATEIALNVQRALSEFSITAAREALTKDSTDENKRRSEQEAAKATLTALADMSADDLDTYFAECDPFPLADRIDPSTAQEHRDAAVRAIALSILGIILYVAFRFRSWSFGFAAVVALIHDVLVVLGLVALANWAGLVDARLNLVTVAAFLTLIGYSINDSIVVFDRIRENHGNRRSGLKEIINRSINQTLSRTIRTTTTTWIVVVILLVMNYGKNSALEGFAFILSLGVLIGTYSSVFIASPTLLFLPWLWEKTGSSVKGFAKAALPYVIGSAVLLIVVDAALGRIDFGGDFSLELFNNLTLAFPVGVLIFFLLRFVGYIRLEENAPEVAAT